MTLIGRMHEQLPSLSKAKRRVAQVVLSTPEKVVSKSIAALAEEAQVSEPTVMRFCRTLGCGGFGDFKLRLAQSLAVGTCVYEGVRPGDSARTYLRKVFDGSIEALLETRNNLEPEVFERAVAVLAAASRLEFYGFAASGAVAVDAQGKFLHLTGNCVAYTDAHMQVMSAASLEPSAVVVAISHTGRTRELLESVRLARSSGATVLAVTRPHSPLAELGTLLIPVSVTEDTDLYPPAMSRLAHLVVLDVLAVGVALHGGPRASARIRSVKRALKAKRSEGGEAGLEP